MTPIVAHPRHLNVRFREKLRLIDCIKDGQWKPLKEIREIVDPLLSMWQVMHISYFIKSLHVDISKVPLLTEFEQLCRKKTLLKHTLSRIYNYLISQNDKYNINFIVKYEN